MRYKMSVAELTKPFGIWDKAYTRRFIKLSRAQLPTTETAKLNCGLSLLPTTGDYPVSLVAIIIAEDGVVMAEIYRGHAFTASLKEIARKGTEVGPLVGTPNCVTSQLIDFKSMYRSNDIEFMRTEPEWVPVVKTKTNSNILMRGLLNGTIVAVK